jgi:hypothetical protein
VTAIDRFTSNAYGLLIEGDSYRPRVEPRLTNDAQEGRQNSVPRLPVAADRVIG